jgi:hypothetical protein
MNHLKYKVNNNLLRLIGQYNMISKESVLTNKVKILVDINDIYLNSLNVSIKKLCKDTNYGRILFPQLFIRLENVTMEMIKRQII